MLTWLTGRKDHQLKAQRLYDAIVAQSRLPAFYSALGVPDTVTGRFEMIVLHMFLMLERLDREPADAAREAGRIGQALNEAFVADMDSAMREMGVADIRVSKRMHQAAGAFFGRLMAYRKAIGTEPEPGAPDPLAEAVARNVLADRTDDVTRLESGATEPWNADEAAAAIAVYVRAAARLLSETAYERLSTGAVAWPDIAADVRRIPR